MTILHATTVGDIASTRPRSIPLFARHGIDFCCGGNRTLGEVCAEKGLDLDEIRGQIEALPCENDGGEADWASRPLTPLIDHILDRYHARLRVDLPLIDALLEKVRAAHAERHSAALAPLQHVFRHLRGELEPHMEKEERVLFPHMQDLQQVQDGTRPPQTVRMGLATAATQVMRQEHESAAAALASIRALTGGYAAPEDACASFRALYTSLASLEDDLKHHIHLENNILFPRALRIEQGAGQPSRTD